MHAACTRHAWHTRSISIDHQHPTHIHNKQPQRGGVVRWMDASIDAWEDSRGKLTTRARRRRRRTERNLRRGHSLPLCSASSASSCRRRRAEPAFFAHTWNFRCRAPRMVSRPRPLDVSIGTHARNPSCFATRGKKNKRENVEKPALVKAHTRRSLVRLACWLLALASISSTYRCCTHCTPVSLPLSSRPAHPLYPHKRPHDAPSMHACMHAVAR